jgi:stage III sporulation protein AC
MDLILKVAGVGIVTTVIDVMLKGAKRENESLMVTMAGIVMALILILTEVGRMLGSLQSFALKFWG